MFYREAGQYKTTYAADQAVFPILQDRIGIAVILVVAYALVLIRQRLPAQRDDDPVPDLRAGGDRAQSAHRLYRPAVARHRRLHGGRRLCLLQADDDFPRREHHRLDRRSRGFSRRPSGSMFGLPSLRIKGFYLAVATLAAQFFLEWCFIRIPWLVQLQRLRRDRGAAARSFSASSSPARARRRRRATSSC